MRIQVIEGVELEFDPSIWSTGIPDGIVVLKCKEERSTSKVQVPFNLIGTSESIKSVNASDISRAFREHMESAEWTLMPVEVKYGQ